MKYTLRNYQKQASDAVVRLFTSKADKNGLVILPTGAGKSLVIADIASRLEGPLLVFQPSKFFSRTLPSCKAMESSIAVAIVPL